MNTAVTAVRFALGSPDPVTVTVRTSDVDAVAPGAPEYTAPTLWSPASAKV